MFTILPSSSLSPLTPGRRLVLPLLGLMLLGLLPGASLAESRADPEQILAESERLSQEDCLPFALARADEALRLYREDGDRSGQLKTLLAIGRLQRGEDFPAAVAFYEEALVLAWQVGDRRSEATALNGLGLIEWQYREPRTALDYHTSALRIWEELGDGEKQASELHNIGACQYRLAGPREALVWYEKAGKLQEKPDPDVLNGMAVAHAELGHVDQAFVLVREAFELIAGDPVIEAAVLDTMATLLRRTGELQEALDAFERALGLSRDHVITAKTHDYLSMIYREMGEPARALEHSQKALGLHRDLGNSWRQVNTLVYLGRIALDQSDYATALGRFDEALRLAEGRESRRGRASALHAIGSVHRSRGELEKALGPLREALDLYGAVGDPQGRAAVLLELAQVREALGKGDEAAADLTQALTLAEGIRAYKDQTEALYLLARLDRDQGRLPEARERIQQALRLLEQVRSNVSSPLLRSTFLGRRRRYHELEIDLLLRLAGRGSGVSQEDAFHSSERALARGLLDLLAEGRTGVDQGISPELKQRETEVERQLTFIQRWLFEELSKTRRDDQTIASLRRDLEQAEEDRRQLEARIRREHPRYAQVSYPEPLRLEKVQKLLDGRTALLEYFLGEEGSFLFVVTRDGFAAHRLPKAAVLKEKVDQVRAALEEPGRRGLSTYRKAAAALYRDLLGPVRPAIAGKRLLIAPDGDLHLLSFEALLTEEAGDRPLAELPYLLREHAVAYVPSASVLASLKEKEARTEVASGGGSEAPKRFLAFADPVLPQESIASAPSTGPVVRGPLSRGEPLQMPRLFGSAEEVDKIAQLYPAGEVQIYKRSDACEANVKNNGLLERARRIHFATHGVIDRERPDLASLVLTPDAGSDGFLQAHEIFNLKLSADLVVLSACETGLGRKVTGEGLIGLTRAFFYAGAPSVVVSLWRVADIASTPDLMVRFYRQLDGGADKAEALRQSKLQAIGSGVHAHPYYWAPFVLIGDPDGSGQ